MELVTVVGTSNPFTRTTLSLVKFVPVSVTAVSVWNGPKFGLMDVSVGAIGSITLIETALESDGVALGVDTVMAAVPEAATRLSGTLTNSALP